jgi:hypothetical protein
MSQDISNYLSLLQQFLDNRLPVEAFQTEYLDMFKRDDRPLDSVLFNIHDTLFGNTDSFVSDPVLRSQLESQMPGFYLDEPTLRRRVSEAYAELKKYAARS